MRTCAVSTSRTTCRQQKRLPLRHLLPRGASPFYFSFLQSNASQCQRFFTTVHKQSRRLESETGAHPRQTRGGQAIRHPLVRRKRHHTVPCAGTRSRSESPLALPSLRSTQAVLQVHQLTVLYVFSSASRTRSVLFRHLRTWWRRKREPRRSAASSQQRFRYDTT
jgi:hypothetical protein